MLTEKALQEMVDERHADYLAEAMRERDALMTARMTFARAMAHAVTLPHEQMLEAVAAANNQFAAATGHEANFGWRTIETICS